MTNLLSIVRWLRIYPHCTGDTVLRAWMGNPLNQWICADPRLFRALYLLLSKCRQHELRNLRRLKIIFARSNGHVSCSLSIPKSGHVVLIFPILQEWLAKGESRLAEAVIAHELGHLLAGHHQRSIPIIKAQFEADAFAVTLGYGQEIKELLKREKSQEARERTTKISLIRETQKRKSL